jgi:hypothetical protein
MPIQVAEKVFVDLRGSISELCETLGEAPEQQWTDLSKVQTAPCLALRTLPHSVVDAAVVAASQLHRKYSSLVLLLCDGPLVRVLCLATVVINIVRAT